MTFAMCHACAGGTPRMIGTAANMAESLMRPHSTTSAPRLIASSTGSVPIIPTTWVARSITSSVSGSDGASGFILPARSLLRR